MRGRRGGVPGLQDMHHVEGLQVRGLLLVWWVWLPKLFMRNCPQCGHTLRRHRYREDGSFRD